MNFRRRAVPALLTALLALALPATASAEIGIDSAADEHDAVPGGVCETAAGDCTLRAAIEVANLAGTAQDLIFDTDTFDGQHPGATIALTSPLPEIEAPVSLIASGGCSSASIRKPCAGVDGSAANAGITVEADDVTIANLSITGAPVGIEVADESQGFAARGNWIGIELDGEAGPNGTGIFIGPGSDGATIGGPMPFERNVIAGNENEGLDIEGASDTVIRGNYFGVEGNGTTWMANGTNIEITDSTEAGGFPAEDNEIGSTIEGAPLISEACDGGCNVISGGVAAGIVLSDSEASEAPASGPTAVHGNYIGLNAAGSGTIANFGRGITAFGVNQLTIGGLAPSEKNYLAGGELGIVGDGEDFEVLGNAIGIAPNGSDLTAPGNAGVFVGIANVSGEPSVEGNEIRMGGGTGIEAWFATGRIVDNHLEGGSSGIRTFAGDGGGLIAGNEIKSPTDYGILVESSNNEIRRNSVFGSARVGIVVRNPLVPLATPITGNLIGANSADGENVIEGSREAAIEIFEEATEPGNTTEIARNRGSQNGGLFIDLVAGANGGILPPAFSAATQSKAEGTAEPGATVRVFRKASAEQGELQSFLAEATADGAGSWKTSYPSIPAGTLVAATQTSVQGGTSELATTTAAADPDDGDKGGGGPDDTGDKGKGTAKDAKPPQTTIRKGPKAKSRNRTAKFRFTAGEPGSTFQCKLDKGPYRRCRSPKTYRNLKPGRHVFRVRAVDKAGNVDPTPAKRKFRVLP